MIVNDQTRWSYFNELKRGNKCSEVPRLFRLWSVLPLAIPGDWDQAGGSFGIEEAVALNAATITFLMVSLRACREATRERTRKNTLANPHTCLV